MADNDPEKVKVGHFERIISKGRADQLSIDYQRETDEDKYIGRDKLSSAGNVKRISNPEESYYYSLEYDLKRGEMNATPTITEVTVWDRDNNRIIDYDGEWKTPPTTPEARAILDNLEDYAGKVKEPYEQETVTEKTSEQDAIDRINAAWQGKDSERDDMGR